MIALKKAGASWQDLLKFIGALSGASGELLPLPDDWTSDDQVTEWLVNIDESKLAPVITVVASVIKGQDPQKPMSVASLCGDSRVVAAADKSGLDPAVITMILELAVQVWQWWKNRK